MEESKATSSIQSGTVVVSTDTPLGEIRNIFSFFHEPKNVVQIQVANVKTRYVWQNLSGFQ